MTFRESFVVVYISASLKILGNVNVIIGTKKYDMDTLVFHLVEAFGKVKGFVNLITT